MKNKKLFGICSLLFATGLILGACNTKANSSSQTSETPTTSSSSSSEAVEKFTVRFLVEGQVVQTSEVEKGQLAHYDGETPTKAGDAQADIYGFRNWDKDLNTPITANTDFNAVFAAYGNDVIEGFESYGESADLADAGWKTLGYDNSTGKWTEEAAGQVNVSLGHNPTDGGKNSLTFNSFKNGSGYKFVKTFQKGDINKAYNAMKFSLRMPNVSDAQLIMHTESITLGDKTYDPAFYYFLDKSSSEYVDYTLSLADPGWDLWKEGKGNDIPKSCEWLGIHPDDLLKHIVRIEFYIKANENGWPFLASFDNLRFVTLDEPGTTLVEKMGSYTTYTGTLTTGNVVKISLTSATTATASIIDMETPMNIPGKISVSADKKMTFTSDAEGQLTYVAQLVNGGQQMKFVSCDGAMKAYVKDVDLNAVQVVDNYEQYTQDGESWHIVKEGDVEHETDPNDPAQRYGCRGNYYSEYYTGSGSAEFGGSGWNLMRGDGSQLKLKTDGNGHNGSKNYLCLKHGKDNAMRYMQWGLIDGTSEQKVFRGSKLSFWAKTNGLVKEFKVYMYNQTMPRITTMDTRCKVLTVNETEAIGQWKHYELDLNPSIEYYGFLIHVSKLTAYAESYLYIDDVEVYTANPYAQYVAPQNLELPQGKTYAVKIAGLINAKLDILADKAVRLSAPGLGMNLEGTYESTPTEVTIKAGGDQYVVTPSKDLNELVYKSVTGTGPLAQYFKNMNFVGVPFAENAETYLSDGKMYYQSNTNKDARSGARGAFYCEYKGGKDTDKSEVGGTKWILMGGSGDQLQLDKSVHQEGNQSLKMRYSSAGEMRYMQWELYDGTAKAKTGYNRFGFWIKNASANATKVNVSVYKASKVYTANVGDNAKRAMTGQFDLPAGTDWTFKTIELDPTANYYGFAVWFAQHGSSAGFVNFDNAYFFNDYDSHELNFFAKQGLALSGAITAGNATLTFGERNAVTLNAGSDIPGTFAMRMGATAQELVITTAAGTITGTYAVNNIGVVTFTVTNVTGDQLSAAVNVGAVLSNAH